MRKIEQLAVLKAMKEKCDEAVKAVGSEVSDEMRLKFPHGGRETICINGVEVGDFIVNRPGRPGEAVYVENVANFKLWFMNNARKSLVRDFIEDQGMSAKFARWWIDATGEVPDGCVMRPTPAKPQGTSFRNVNFETVRGALGTTLPEALERALEEPDD